MRVVDNALPYAGVGLVFDEVTEVLVVVLRDGEFRLSELEGGSKWSQQTAYGRKREVKRTGTVKNLESDGKSM